LGVTDSEGVRAHSNNTVYVGVTTCTTAVPYPFYESLFFVAFVIMPIAAIAGAAGFAVYRWQRRRKG
jgi:hypothetical protein